MRFPFSCPGCRKRLNLPWAIIGATIRCKRCGTEFVIPAPLELKKKRRSSDASPADRRLDFDRSVEATPVTDET